MENSISKKVRKSDQVSDMEVSGNQSENQDKVVVLLDQSDITVESNIHSFKECHELVTPQEIVNSTPMICDIDNKPKGRHGNRHGKKRKRLDSSDESDSDKPPKKKQRRERRNNNSGSDSVSSPLKKRRKLTPERRSELQAVRIQKRLERMANMTPFQLERFQKRQDRRMKNRELKKNMKKKRQLEKKEKQDLKQQAKLDKLSPISRENCKRQKEEKQKKRDEIRELKNGMTRDEKKNFQKQQYEKRQVGRKEKLQQKLDQMSPTKRDKFEKKIEAKRQKKEEFSKLPKEEQDKLKMERKEKKREQKKCFKYLATQWLETIPDKIDYLILDGNNMRGGGPKRHSRDVLLSHIKKVVESTNEINPITTEITCLFDHGIKSYEPIEGIDVQFSGQNVIADDVIVKLSKEFLKKNKNAQVLVITCDRGLALRILELEGGHVMRNRSFTSICDGLKNPYGRHAKKIS